MKSLSRQQFLDLTWGVADLDSVAEFWLRLYEQVAPRRAFSISPRHATEIRLQGFPVFAGEELRLELERRAAASDLSGPKAKLSVPDTLVLSSEPIRGAASPPAGLGLPVLTGPVFDGLAVELRFCTSGAEGRFLRTGTADSTLVVVGELRGGSVLVKSVWRSGSSRWEDDVYWSQPFPDEGALMAGLEEFRRTGEVNNQLAKRLFKPSADDYLERWALRMTYVSFEGPRLLPLLSRVVIFALLIAGFGSLIYVTAVNKKWLLLVPFVIFGLGVLMLVRQFIWYEIRLLTCCHAFRTGYAAQYQESAGYSILEPHESEALCYDSAVRKYMAEILAAGLVLVGDVASRTAVGTGAVYRIFRASDGVSYFVLICHLGLWPMAITFQAQTFFTSGGRVDSVTGHTYGFLRVAAGPNTLIRLDREQIDPIAFLRSHAAATESFANELGLTPMPHESIAQYTRRQEAIHEEERQQLNDCPYSWRDHLRWYLQLPRREQRALR